MIAEEVVVEEEDIVMDFPKRRALPGILHVCHQPRMETAPVYFKDNTFMFHESPKDFTNALDRKNGHHKLVTAVYVWMREQPNRSIEAAQKWSTSTERYGKLKKGTVMTASYEKYGTSKPMSVYFVDSKGDIEFYDKSLHFPHTTVGSPVHLKS